MQARTIVVQGPPGSLLLEFSSACGSISIDKTPELVHSVQGRRVILKVPELQEKTVAIEVKYSGEFLELERPAIHKPSAAESSKLLKKLQKEDVEDDIWGWRDQRARAGKELASAMLFFNLLDYQAPFTDARVSDLTGQCKGRFETRITNPPAKYAATPLARISLQHFSGMILAGLRTFFPMPDELGFDLREVALAFSRFAAGDLSMVDGIGAPTCAQRQACMPNSAFYFLLAEFGEMCADENVDRAEWSVLMPILVHTCAVFGRHFVGDPPSADKKFCCYGPVEPKVPKVVRSPKEIREELKAFKDASGPYGEPAFYRAWQTIIATHVNLSCSPPPLQC